MSKTKRSIWKYELQVTDAQVVRMPVGARILTVQVQRDTPCLWALVDEEAKREPRVIRMLGTGNPFDADGTYIGTIQTHHAALVWHVFEVER